MAKHTNTQTAPVTAPAEEIVIDAPPVSTDAPAVNIDKIVADAIAAHDKAREDARIAKLAQAKAERAAEIAKRVEAVQAHGIADRGTIRDRAVTYGDAAAKLTAALRDADPVGMTTDMFRDAARSHGQASRMLSAASHVAGDKPSDLAKALRGGAKAADLVASMLKL